MSGESGIAQPVAPDEVRAARAAWSRIVEPADQVAGALVRAIGPVDALRWLESLGPDETSVRHGVDRLCDVVAVEDGWTRRRLGTAVARWLPRLGRVDASRDLENLARLGGRVVVPEDDEWPVRLDDLGDAAPFCLWVRGGVKERGAGALLDRAVSIVGARASTGYGDRVAGELAAGLVVDTGSVRSFSTVSGGAYGIDAAVHRATVAVGGVTTVVLAGGVDRLYPAGNAAMLGAVVESGGLILSEVPPGSVPSRVRFLRRNRLIAAAGRSTVVVEAAWRSGSLVTARLAAELGRPVGAVPGPVTSAASAGCHRLLREGVAVCVTDTAEVLELSGVAGEGVAEVAEVGARRDEVCVQAVDGLDLAGRATYDALPLRRPVTVDDVARGAGLAPKEVMAALGTLEIRGLAACHRGLWVKG